MLWLMMDDGDYRPTGTKFTSFVETVVHFTYTLSKTGIFVCTSILILRNHLSLYCSQGGYLCIHLDCSLYITYYIHVIVTWIMMSTYWVTNDNMMTYKERNVDCIITNRNILLRIIFINYVVCTIRWCWNYASKYLLNY
jgi:hypothetical protein